LEFRTKKYETRRERRHTVSSVDERLQGVAQYADVVEACSGKHTLIELVVVDVRVVRQLRRVGARRDVAQNDRYVWSEYDTERAHDKRDRPPSGRLNSRGEWRMFEAKTVLSVSSTRTMDFCTSDVFSCLRKKCYEMNAHKRALGGWVGGKERRRTYQSRVQ
jgi:hypothetical protein